MQRAFFTRAPDDAELTLLRKYLGTYRDGTGGYREEDASSRADSRQIERCFAELLDGATTENKNFYDFTVESNESGGIAYRGASIKSKELKKLMDFKKQNSQLRAHLEISNSNSADWLLCAEYGLNQTDFANKINPEKFGEIILKRQEIERALSENKITSTSTDVEKTFIKAESIFISLLYSPSIKGERNWLVSVFPIQLPKPARWEFSGRRLVGYDEDDGVIYEWYALSGSQFKYYPKISDRSFGTGLFTLPKPAVETLKSKAKRLFKA